MSGTSDATSRRPVMRHANDFPPPDDESLASERRPVLEAAAAARPARRFTACSLLALRATALAFATAMTAVLGYTIAIDGSPFRSELLIPWMNATLFDFYFNVALLAAWVFVREQSAWAAAAWVLALICLGSAATWVYVLAVALRLREGDPIARLLLGDGAAA